MRFLKALLITIGVIILLTLIGIIITLFVEFLKFIAGPIIISIAICIIIFMFVYTGLDK